MALTKRLYEEGKTAITAQNLNEIQDEVIRLDADKAPSGFGLGTTSKHATDANTQLNNGYFYTTSSTANASIIHGAGHIRTYSTTEVVQNIFRTTTGAEIVRYSTDSGATWTEEHVNPGMGVGTEYRTAWRYEGKPVYAKLVDFGELTNATGKNVAHATTVNQQVIELWGVLSDGVPFTLGYNYDRTSNRKFWVDATNWNIRILCEGDMTALTAKVLVKYVKL